MSALLFGSLSTISDTSELQRRAFNEAFAAHGLDWLWSREDYQAMLGGSGGASRVAEYAEARGEDVDASAVHARKSEIFQGLLAEEGPSPREGVLETVRAAREAGVKVGFVTTTSRANIDALLTSLGDEAGDDLAADRFDVVVDASEVEENKPAPEAYLLALDRLGLTADEVVALEDNEGGLQAASAAGVACVAFPNVNTAGGDFGDAVEQVDRLDPQRVLSLVKQGGPA